VSLRYFNAAGADESGELQEKHDPETHLIPLAFAAARTGPRLHVYGDDYPTLDGTCIRDYVHVNDIADAHVRALQYLEIGGETSAMNIGSGRATSVFEIIRAVAEHTHRTVRSTIVPRRKGDPPQLIASYAKARTILSWTPKRNLKDIIRTAAV
jgi:UDP-glucose 4-epimerase